jgi:hypothetical protein
MNECWFPKKADLDGYAPAIRRLRDGSPSKLGHNDYLLMIAHYQRIAPEFSINAHLLSAYTQNEEIPKGSRLDDHAAKLVLERISKEGLLFKEGSAFTMPQDICIRLVENDEHVKTQGHPTNIYRKIEIIAQEHNRQFYEQNAEMILR